MNAGAAAALGGGPGRRRWRRRVEMFHAAIGAASCRALRTTDLARAEILGAVERDQHPFAQAVEACSDPGTDDRMPMARRRPALGGYSCRRDCRDAQQGLAVGPAVAAGQCPLMRQERRAFHEKQREGRHANIGHRVMAVMVVPCALVWETGADHAQFGAQVVDDDHAGVESRSKSRRKRQLAAPAAGREIAHNMWQIGLGNWRLPGCGGIPSVSPLTFLRTRLNRIESCWPN